MSLDQLALLALMATTLVVLASDRLRYDVVAVGALLGAVGLGLVPIEHAFAGFASPVVVTVAALLVIGRTLVALGLLEGLARRLADGGRTPLGLIVPLCGLGALAGACLSSFGALALMMPVALVAGTRRGIAASRLLLPLSFSTLLGGMTTLIGSPVNLLIAQARQDALGRPFALFDFAAAGLPVAVAGLLWLGLASWRLLPERGPATTASGLPEGLEVGPYQTEGRVGGDSPLIGLRVPAFERSRAVRVHGVIRGGLRVFARPADIDLRAGDVLLLEAALPVLQALAAREGIRPALPEARGGEEILEAVITPASIALGSCPLTLDAPGRWRVEIMAVARNGRRFEGGLGELSLMVGDLLLLRGRPDHLQEALAALDCLPLRDRGIRLAGRGGAVPLVLFALALALAVLGLVPPPVAFVAALFGMVVSGALPLSEVYRRIDWPVVVFLAALIPIGDALAESGAAAGLAGGVLKLAGDIGPHALLAMTLAAAMGLSPLLGGVATTLMLAPVVLSLAAQASVSADPFLIAVAIGASADFFTPFGYHNNALILGPGGYRFLDYGRAGLPLALIVLGVALAVIPQVWPF